MAILCHPQALDYDFGPQHPLKPIRITRTAQMLREEGVEITDAADMDEADLRRVHAEEYIQAVQQSPTRDWGFSSGDTPPFPGIHQAALHYSAATLQAAYEVRDGAELGLALTGGLHHAQRTKANGFCIYNDPAIACLILRERFERVLYVDIDLHHGDGVQAIFADDPSVLTFSIHQDGRTLYPGTGAVEEPGINLPLPPGTTGGAWLGVFQEVLGLASLSFQPQAVVLQMGADPHPTDPLGRLEVPSHCWRSAVATVRDLGLPLVACTGGGYALDATTRMWTGAYLALLGRDVPSSLDDPPQGHESGVEAADALRAYWADRLGHSRRSMP